jgi:tight adherence protein C
MTNDKKNMQQHRIVRDASGGVFGAWTEALASQIPESEKERREFGAILKQAGLYSRTARASVYAYRFLLLVFPLFCAGLIAVTSPLSQSWKIMGVGGFVAAVLSIIPRLFVWYRRRVRLVQINGGLADMLDMLSMCMGGGMSISASLDHVAKNLTSYPALSEELHIMRRQADVGSLRIALADWASRIDTPEVRQVATLLARGDALGTSLSGSLLDQADHFRTARKQLATLQANRMPVLLTFPLLFCFAPAVLIILMSPAMLQISDFMSPENRNNPLANNESISTRRITDTLGSLNQDISAANQQPTPASPATRPSLAPPAARP